MRKATWTRRDFVRDVGLMGGGAYFVCYTLGCEKKKAPPAPAAPGPAVTVTRAGLRTFTGEEIAAVEMLVDRILPPGPEMGAREAGCAAYIDCMLAVTPIQRQKEDFLAGLGSFMRQAKSVYAKEFSQLSATELDQMLQNFQTSKFSGEQKFFHELVVLTVEGYFGDPSYGGNKDRVGWRLCGFEPAMPMAGPHGCGHG